ncbi:unnamed protein product [Sphagnum troendelagicum]|uniref:Uncharacterized protein n=1 Tax=Sphagnum troendelagicum TaxID=128251 RepID=A0ABP0TY30_9BRYO
MAVSLGAAATIEDLERAHSLGKIDRSRREERIVVGKGGGGRELESGCFVRCLLTGIHVASSSLSRSLAIAY